MKFPLSATAVCIVFGMLGFFSLTAGERPGFLPPAIKDKDVPMTTDPVTEEEIDAMTEGCGWGTFSRIAIHDLLLCSGGMLFSETPQGVTLPHATWAKPWAGGKLKLLVVTQPDIGRSVKELTDRMDGEVATSYIDTDRASYAQINPGDVELVERMTLERLSKHNPDALLLGAVRGGSKGFLFPKICTEIRKRVEGGMGLVIIVPGGMEFKGQTGMTPEQWPALPLLVDLTTATDRLFKGQEWIASGEPHFSWWGLPYGALPPIFLPVTKSLGEGWTIRAKVGDKPWILTKEVGKGRVVAIINYYNAELLPSIDDKSWRPGLEYRRLDDRVSAVLKSLLWSARKDTGVLLQLDTPKSVSWKASFKVRAGVLQSGRNGSGKMQLSIQDQDYNRVFQSEAVCGLKTGDSVEFDIPPLGVNGKYFIDAVLRDKDGGSLNWHSASVTVENGLKLQVKPEKDVYSPDEKLVADIVAGNDAAAYLPLTLECELWDRFGRIVSRESKEVKGGKCALRFETKLSDCPSKVMMLVGRATSNGKVIARGEAEITLPTFGLEGDHRLIGWTGTGADNLHYQLIGKIGYDTIATGPWGPPVDTARMAAWNGLGIFLENANHLSTGLNDKNFPGSKTDYDSYVEKTCIPMADMVLRKYGCRLLSISNEAAFYKNIPVEKRIITPVQEAAFQAYLKETYGDVASLNRQWETEFKSFDQARPMPFGAKPDSANFSRFIDWDQFMNRTSVSEQKKTIEAYFKTMGGICPWGSTSGGNNEMQFAAGATLHGNTLGDGRHFLSPSDPSWFDMTRGGTAFGWRGYDYPEWEYNFFSWHNILHGSKTDAFFVTTDDVTPAGAFSGRARWHLKYEAEILNGIGRLLATSERKNDPVAIMRSDISDAVIGYFAKQQSDDKHAGQFYGRFASSSYRSFVQLILDSQLHPTFVTDKDIVAGRLDDMKMLFLCATCAMSEKTAKAIREFAEKGGVVVADLTPGIFDEHGKMLPEGRLDDFFGFKRSNLKLESYPAEYTLGILKDTKTPYYLPKEWFRVEIKETGIAVTDGEALGQHVVGNESPAFIFKKHGKGASLYLNYLDTQYKNTRDPYHLRFMKALLSWKNIRPFVEITYGHVPLEQFDVTHFSDDKAIHAGINRDQTNNRLSNKAVVNFPQDGHGYDVREGRYLGAGRSFEVDVPQPTQKLVSLLPCRIDQVVVKADNTVEPGQTLAYSVKSKIEGDKTSLVYRITVTDPDGEKSEAYSLKARTEKGSTTYDGRIRTALNDKPGIWKISVTEVISGKSGETSFKVK